MSAHLSFYINGHVLARCTYDPQRQAEKADRIIRYYWPDLIRRGRVAVIAEDQDGVAYIIASNGMPPCADGMPHNWSEGEI